MVGYSVDDRGELVIVDVVLFNLDILFKSLWLDDGLVILYKRTKKGNGSMWKCIDETCDDVGCVKDVLVDELVEFLLK
jgi:hypothetical protein